MAEENNTLPVTPVASPAPAPAPREPLENKEHFSREYVSELRSENRDWRLKAQAQEQARQAAETAAQAKVAEAEAKAAAAEAAATAKAEAAEKVAQDKILRAELRTAALKAGMIDLDGLKLADLSKVSLGEDGEVKGADELMASLREGKPYLFGAAPSGTSSTSTPPAVDTGKPKLAKDMTPEERKAFLDSHQKKHGR